MKALALAAAWNWPGTRVGEAIFEVESTGNPKIDNELADGAAAVLRRVPQAAGAAAIGLPQARSLHSHSPLSS